MFSEKIINELKLWGYTPQKIYFKYFSSNSYPRIIANSIPKSGTHLLERLLYLLPPYSRQFSRTLGEKQNTYINLVSQIKKLKLNQFMISHLFYKKKYIDLIMKNNIKFILIIRDPRDIVISSVNYITNINKKHRLHKYFKYELKNFHQRLRVCIKGNKKSEANSIGYLLEQFYPWFNFDSCLVIRFEDLVGIHGGGSKEKQTNIIKKIAKYLNLNISNEEIAKLRKNIIYKYSKTFNKGIIGQWKSIFNEKHKAMFKEVAGKQLIKYGYEKDFNW